MGMFANRFLKIILATESVCLKPKALDVIGTKRPPGHHAARWFREDTWGPTGTGRYFGVPIGIAVGAIGSS